MPAENAPVGITTDRVSAATCSRCGGAYDVSGVEPFTKVKCPQCGSIETVPARLGSFLLLDLMGTGGMGAVYYARDEVLGRAVAIKVMLKSLGENRDFVETFKREAQAVAKLNHPNIVQIYSFGKEKGQPYIVMELVAGRRFDKMVDAGKALDPVLVMQVGLNIAEGLRAADEVGLVHGDIKPENILLDEKMNAKLVDFGLASFVHQTSRQGVWGTPYYIAPEKLRRQRPDARTDIYSLGATLYHALAGRPPFEGETPTEVVKARLEKDPVPLRQIRPEIPAAVDDIVMRMLARDAALRYPNYASVISDMQKALVAMGERPAAAGDKAGRVRLKKHGAPAALKPSTKGIGGGKIVVHRKGPSAGSERVTTPLTALPEPEPASKSAAGKVFAWLIVIALLGGGGTWLGIRLKERHDVRLRDLREAYALRQERERMDATFSQIRTAVSNVAATAGMAAVHVRTATNAVFEVLGERMTTVPVVPATNAVAGAAAAVSNAAPASEEAAPPQEEPAEPPPAAEEPVRRLAEEVLAGAVRLREMAAAARKIETEAGAVREDGLNAQLSEEAAAKGDELAGQLAAVEEIRTGAQEALARAAEVAAEAEAIRTRVAAERAAEAGAAEEAARRQAEEAARRQAEEARAARAAEEQARAEQAFEGVTALLRQHLYREAADRLAAQLDQFQTEEGRAAQEIHVERCRRLADLKRFLIERINQDPFPWGWGRGNMAADILGASTKGLTIRGGLVVPWTDVDTAQMLRIVRRYLSAQNVPARELADQNLAAAIFCYLNGGTEAAAAYARKAVELRPGLAGNAERLLPPDPSR